MLLVLPQSASPLSRRPKAAAYTCRSPIAGRIKPPIGGSIFRSSLPHGSGRSTGHHVVVPRRSSQQIAEDKKSCVGARSIQQRRCCRAQRSA